MVSEARQFSSYVLILGRIASNTLFQPKYALIVQNRDLLRIPLLLEQVSRLSVRHCIVFSNKENMFPNTH